MAVAEPIQDRAIATRQKILDAAQNVILADGAFRATTAAVAATAGVSIGTVYRYFEDMPAILHELGWAAIRISPGKDDPMPTSVLPSSFQIEAEYLHLYVGRRIAVRVDIGAIPFTIQTVRHEPERRTVIVEVDTPMIEPLEIEFVPGDIVEVQHVAPVIA